MVSRPWETQGIAQGSAFHDFLRPFIVAGKLCPDGKVGAAFQEELCSVQAAIIEKDVDAGGKLRRTAVSAYDIVEGRAGVFGAWLRAIWICPVFQEPFQRGRLHGFARREEDGEITTPEGVHVRAAGYQKVHHGNAMAKERGPHQGPVATW